MIDIRPERPQDIKDIYEVNKRAFKTEIEARLVDKVRETEQFIPELSLVAVKDDKIVGHILISVVWIKTEAELIPILGLAPLAVLPEFQNQGIGSELVREALERSKALADKYKVVAVVGHAKFYPRFGFISASAKGIKMSFKVPDETFMVYELSPHALAGIKGTIVHPSSFEEAITPPPGQGEEE